MNVIFHFVRRTCLVPALAVLVGQACVAYSQTLLIDFGNNVDQYRGLPVENPDANGNYWNSIQPGLLVTNMIGIANNVTTIDLAWDTPVATDSYNGPAGATDAGTLTTDVQFTDIDPVALGNLGGALEGPFDYAAGFNGIEHFPVRFQIQGLNPASTYNLTFFGSHSFSSDATTVYTVYTDDTYTTEVASTTLLIQNPFFTPNRDRIATIERVSPQADDILYIEFVGETGFGGYLNDMQIEANAPSLAGDYDGDGTVDGADLDVWEGEFGDIGAGLAADGDADGDADGADFLIWQSNFGASSPAIPAAGVVPEPAGVALLLVGVILLPATKRRFRRSA